MSQTAVIAGVGSGLGESLARKFADEGVQVGLFARSAEYIEDLADDLGDSAGDAVAVPMDLADPAQIAEGFDRVREVFGPVNVLVYHASAAPWKGIRAIGDSEFETALDVGPRAALHCSQIAVEDMLAADGGTILFTGATTSVRGRDGAIGFSAAKFAVRGMAESMARELGPEGIHVAHVVIDGQILTPDAKDRYGDRPDESFLDPDEIAKNYWHLVEQDRSAWTLELDMRPHVEEF